MALFIIILIFLVLAGLFARFLVKRDQGEREPIGALWVAFGFGWLAIVLAVVLSLLFLPDIDLEAPQTLATYAFTMLGVGVIEELCKCLPLMWFIWNKRYFNEHTDGVIYFALAGMGFGLPENILYTLTEGTGAGIGRLFMTPVFHAAITGLIGYAFIRCKLDGISKARFVAVIAAAISIHGLYNFGLVSAIPLFFLLSIMITLALTVGIFLLYARAKSLDQLTGLSVVGSNTFCRSCGHPNPKHRLYCTHCGKRA